MGYTHYCYTELNLNPDNFKKVKEDFLKMIPILEHLGVKLADGHGQGKPIKTKKVYQASIRKGNDGKLWLRCGGAYGGYLHTYNGPNVATHYH